MTQKFLDHLTEALDGMVGEECQTIWRHSPPALDIFVSSQHYLGQPPLSPRQKKAILDALGTLDPERVFDEDRVITTIVLLWGKGSGKDWLSANIVAWFTYVVLCMRDPQGFFWLAPSEPIDIVNVAYSYPQARDVFFEKLKARFRRPCFEKFAPNITEDQIKFPGGVRAHSRHAQAASYDGFNVLVWVMDEASAFKDNREKSNAEEVYKVLRSSATSRFKSRWIGFIISYPREQEDFTIRMYDRSQHEPHISGDKACTWDVRPRLTKEDFDDDYRTNPEEARQLYECEPPVTAGGFFREPIKIDECVDDTIEPILLVEPTITEKVVPWHNLVTGEFEDKQLRFSALNITYIMDVPAGMYYVHGDPGDVTDAFALAVAHPLDFTQEILFEGEIREIRGVQVDLLLQWHPIPGAPVDQINVCDLITTIAEHVPVAKVTFDKWNSLALIQQLLDRSIPAEDMSFSTSQQLAMYRHFRVLAYNNLVKVPRNEDAIWQLKRIKQIGSRIDHPRHGTKDLADAIVAVCWWASMVEEISELRKQVLETINDSSSFAIVSTRMP